MTSAPRSPRVRVAVVDSGAYAGHPHLAGIPIDGFSVLGATAPFDSAPEYDDRTGHGTAAAAAVVWGEPEVELCIVRVLDEDLRTTSFALAEAIRRAAARGARVINLSVGSTRPESKEILGAAVEEAAVMGVLCVANGHPRGRPLWPGDLPGVISAVSHRDCPRADLFEARSPLPRFVTHGYPRPAEGRRPTDNFFGPSFACAHVTARVATLLRADPGLDFHGVVAGLRAASRGPAPK